MERGILGVLSPSVFTLMLPVVIVLLLLTALVATEPSTPGGSDSNQ